MSTLGERIKTARESKGYLQSDLAKLIGVKSSGVISNWEKDLNKPDAEKIVKICEVLNVSVSFLLNYYGKSSFEFTPSEQSLIEKYRLLDPYGQETINIILEREIQRVNELSAVKSEIDSLNSQLETCSSLVSIEDIRPKYYITYYHKLASAGRGEYLFEDIPTDLIAVEDTPVARRADFVIGVIGDSMEPTYHDGDNVFVEKTDIVKIGEIGIFFIGNECFIKEAGADGLISHNSKYPLIPGSDSIRCVGRILGKAERLQHD